MRATLYQDADKATYHNAALEPYGSENRSFFEECRGSILAATLRLDDDQISDIINVKIEDEVVACGMLYRHEAEVCEIVNLYYQDYVERTDILLRLIRLLIKKARNAGYRKLRYSLPRNLHLVFIFLSGVGFVKIDRENSISPDLLPMELMLKL